MTNEYYRLVALRRIVKQRIEQQIAADGVCSQSLARALGNVDRKIARSQVQGRLV